MTGLTASQETRLRAIAGAYLQDTYTRVPRAPVPDDPTTPAVDESTDAWGEETYAPGAGTSGLPCSYDPQQKLALTPDGSQVLVQVPTLLVPVGDPLAVQDTVQAVTDRAGNVLLAGPAVVEAIVSEGTAAGRLVKRVTLRAAGAV